MDNHHDHQEEPKPTNKWIATPILGAFFVIAVIVTFLSFASGTCCGGECKDKAKTEEHGPVKHDTQSENEDMLKDSTTTTTADSTKVNEGAESGGEHHEDEDHGH